MFTVCMLYTYLGAYTSMEDYTFCAICRINHTSGKKHSFSLKHKARLKTILQKFGTKVTDAKKKLSEPVIMRANPEMTAVNIWCYICSQEFKRHVADEHAIIIDAGLIEHLAAPDHTRKVHQFFWENRLSKEQKKKYLVCDEQLDKFKDALKSALSFYEDNEEKELKKAALKIQEVECTRKALLRQDDASNRLTNQTDQQNGSNNGGHFSGSWNRSSGQSTSRNLKIQTEGLVSSEGLTFIGPSGCLLDGNIHTGAVPPWLRADDTEPTETTIGPTEKEFEEHLKRQRKRKLNPARVGANFDHNSTNSVDWMPSFGRVWNSGRRLQSKHQYQRETGNWKKRKVHKSASNV